jgi:photosystem II stability/assembly factor-like uncharacterized protein
VAGGPHLPERQQADRVEGPRIREAGPCGGKSFILRTDDGGRRWTAIRFDRLPGSDSFAFVTPKVGYVNDGLGRLYRTTDGGRTWRLVSGR